VKCTLSSGVRSAIRCPDHEDESANKEGLNGSSKWILNGFCDDFRTISCHGKRIVHIKEAKAKVKVRDKL